ncbi:pentatricopeptide repeat protein [Striga asiatica]|uniref:Pentatricopeptide repeat protein n=1 Tax=Striga asiatica TaxID=4170 RepID=A0A5A7QWC1_STRAF|nr:pentatricopeptide repeat protein [Striga asiatica]
MKIKIFLRLYFDHRGQTEDPYIGIFCYPRRKESCEANWWQTLIIDLIRLNGDDFIQSEAILVRKKIEGVRVRVSSFRYILIEYTDTIDAYLATKLLTGVLNASWKMVWFLGQYRRQEFVKVDGISSMHVSTCYYPGGCGVDEGCARIPTGEQEIKFNTHIYGINRMEIWFSSDPMDRGIQQCIEHSSPRKFG